MNRRRRQRYQEPEGLGKSSNCFKGHPSTAFIHDEALGRKIPLPCFNAAIHEKFFFAEACQECTPLSKESLRDDTVKGYGLRKVKEETFERIAATKDWTDSPEGLILAAKVSDDELVTHLVAESRDGEETVDDILQNMGIGTKLEHSPKCSGIAKEMAGSDRAVLYHPGQVQVLQNALACGRPCVFIVGNNQSDPGLLRGRDSIALNSILVEADFKRLPRSVSAEESVLEGSIKALMDVGTDLRFAVERAILLNLLPMADIAEKDGMGGLIQIPADLNAGNNDPLLSKRKVEILDHFKEFVKSDDRDDILIAPVSVSYDFAGGAKVTINQPFSLQEFTKNFDTTVKASIEEEEKATQFMDSLRDHINSMIVKSFQLCPESLLAFQLLYHGRPKIRTSILRSTLMSDFVNLLTYIKKEKIGLTFSGSDLDVYDHAVKSLSEKGLINVTKTVVTLEKTPDLCDLARSVKRAFLFDAVVTTATLAVLTSASKMGPSILDTSESIQVSLPTVTRSQIFQASQLMHNFLGHEFRAYYPCSNIEFLISDALDKLQQDEILCDATKQVIEGDHLQERLSRRMARHLDLDNQDEYDEYEGQVDDSKITVSRSESARVTLRRNSRIFRPELRLLMAIVDILRKMVETDNAKTDIDAIICDLATSPLDVNQETEEEIFKMLDKLVAMGIINVFSESVEIEDIWMSTEKIEELKSLVFLFIVE